METFIWPTFFWTTGISVFLAGVVSYYVARATASRERVIAEELDALDEYGRSLERARKACFVKAHRVGAPDTRLEDAAKIGESLSALGETIDAKSRRLPVARRAAADALAARLGAIMGLANSAIDVETFFGNVAGLDKRLESERDAVEEFRARIVGH
jgi:hypothetical protein